MKRLFTKKCIINIQKSAQDPLFMDLVQILYSDNPCSHRRTGSSFLSYITPLLSCCVISALSASSRTSGTAFVVHYLLEIAHFFFAVLLEFTEHILKGSVTRTLIIRCELRGWTACIVTAASACGFIVVWSAAAAVSAVIVVSVAVEAASAAIAVLFEVTARRRIINCFFY